MAALRASMKKSVVKEFQCFLFFSEADAKSCMLHAAQMHACMFTLRHALRGDIEAQAYQTVMLLQMEALIWVCVQRHHKAQFALHHAMQVCA